MVCELAPPRAPSGQAKLKGERTLIAPKPNQSSSGRGVATLQAPPLPRATPRGQPEFLLLRPRHASSPVRAGHAPDARRSLRVPADAFRREPFSAVAAVPLVLGVWLPIKLESDGVAWGNAWYPKSFSSTTSTQSKNGMPAMLRQSQDWFF